MKEKNYVLIASCLLFIFLGIFLAVALPEGPAVTIKGNTTKSPTPGEMVNVTGNDTVNPDKAGGFIYYLTLTAESQDTRWKAYVGNVTGTLVLQDAANYNIYEWSLDTSVGGSVFATRTSSSINWSNINCSDAAQIGAEETTMGHTSNPSDNISATFDGTDNTEFYVGSRKISANTCPTTNLYVNGSAPTSDQYEEILLHDGDSLVYTSRIYDDYDSYRESLTADFQMLVPEQGGSGWTSATAYYFYVELS